MVAGRPPTIISALSIVGESGSAKAVRPVLAGLLTGPSPVQYRVRTSPRVAGRAPGIEFTGAARTPLLDTTTTPCFPSPRVNTPGAFRVKSTVIELLGELRLVTVR